MTKRPQTDIAKASPSAMSSPATPMAKETKSDREEESRRQNEEWRSAQDGPRQNQTEMPTIGGEEMWHRRLPQERRIYQESGTTARYEAEQLWEPELANAAIYAEMPQTNGGSAEPGKTEARAELHEYNYWVRLAMDVAEEMLYAEEEKYWTAARAFLLWTASQEEEVGKWVNNYFKQEFGGSDEQVTWEQYPSPAGTWLHSVEVRQIGPYQ